MSLDFVGSPNFVDRSLPRHSSSGARRSRTSSRPASLDNRLPAIDEDSPSPPLSLPQKTHHRPFARRFLGDPPLYGSGHSPPRYTFWDVTGPKGEKFEDLRNNEYIAKRGGWKRICTISLIVLIVLIGLVVGLAVGLTKGISNNSSPPPAADATNSTTPSPPIGPFPAGSYTFTTYLTTASTKCTSNPLSWQCEPSVTYTTDQTNSLATFNWLITTNPPGSTNFSISSTNNPFAIDFANASLTLLDSGTDQERYTFRTPVQKAVFPAFNIKCFYNDTQFTADLYTKKSGTYPLPASASGNAAPAAASSSGAPQPYGPWNHAVDATESIGGGVDVPACYSWVNGEVGGRVTQGFSAQPVGSFCSCAYKNYDG